MTAELILALICFALVGGFAMGEQWQREQSRKERRRRRARQRQIVRETLRSPW